MYGLTQNDMIDLVISKTTKTTNKNIIRLQTISR